MFFICLSYFKDDVKKQMWQKMLFLFLKQEPALKTIQLENSFLAIKVLNYGATLQQLQLKLANGDTQDVIHSYPNAEDYLKDNRYMGATVGRFAGRIANGAFSLDGNNYQLHNINGVHLHGGKEGFSMKFWEVQEIIEGPTPSVTLTYTSPDLEEGYPGILKISACYTLRENTLEIVYKATTNKATIVNLTNHAYFKLDNTESTSHYEIQLNAAKHVAMNELLLPSGELETVKATPLDFTSKKNKRYYPIRYSLCFK